MMAALLYLCMAVGAVATSVMAGCFAVIWLLDDALNWISERL